MRLYTEVRLVYTHAERSHTHVKDPRQSSVDYGNSKAIKYALKSVSLHNVDVGHYMKEENVHHTLTCRLHKNENILVPFF